MEACSPMLDRFMEKVSPEPNSGCWLWTGCVNADGYGHFGVAASKPRKAHRVSYEMFCGEIPRGAIVCHQCDVTSCVNPDHLFIGTPLVNAHDRDSKGRAAIGVRNGKSKITPEIVLHIRRSSLSQRKLAKSLSIHRGTVEAVLSGRTWSHV